MNNPMNRDESAAFNSACWNKEGGAVGHMESVSAAQWAWHECATQHREVMENLQSLNSELLEALEYALPYLQACVPSPRNGINPDCSVDVNCVDRAIAAIVKARSAQ